MDMTERETRDLMNVESFSQLPFIRPAKQTPGGGIRLFGKEFGGPTTDDQSDHIAAGKNNTEPNKETNNNNDNDISSRKFECHYCCRNFPTSQALGGHQNAHKRERQHAKRAHLHSAMAHTGLDPHDYGGLMGYNRLGLGPAATIPFEYHSWSSANTRLYGRASYNNNNNNNNIPTHQPINGSPLATWRVPSVHGSSAFNRERGSNSVIVPRHPQISNNPWFNAKDIDVGSQSRFGKYESKPSMQDHVSLDLHL